MARRAKCVLFIFISFFCTPSLLASDSVDTKTGFVLVTSTSGVHSTDQQPLVVTPADFPIIFQILNNTLQDLTLEVDLGGALQVLNATDGVSTGADALVLQSNVVHLSAAGTSKVEVSLAAPWDQLPQGNHRTYLVAYSEELNKIARTEFIFSVEAKNPIPLASEWDLYYWRWLPFSKIIGARTVDDSYLPLKEEGDPREVPQLLGYLISDQRDEAIVQWNRGEVVRESGLAGAKISLQGIDRFTSKYSGKVDFQPGRENFGEVTLRVFIKDHWIWAVICLGAGILAVVCLQRYLRVGRGILLLRERHAELGISLEEARVHFRRKAVGSPYADFDICLDSSRHQILSALGRLEKVFIQKLEENEDFKVVQNTLEELEVVVAAWPAFFDSLKDLGEALGNAASDFEPPSDFESQLPKCVEKAAELLRPGKLSAEEYRDRLQDINEMTTVVKSWSEVASQVQRQLNDVQALKALSLNPQQSEALEIVRREILATRRQVWRLETTRELEQWAKALNDSQNKLKELDTSHHLQVTTFGASEILDSVRRSQDHSIPNDRQRLGHYRKQRIRYDWLSFGAVLVVALYGGLNQLYHGQEFATPWHYFSALMWGASSKLAVDTVVAGIDRLPSLWKSGGG